MKWVTLYFKIAAMSVTAHRLSVAELVEGDAAVAVAVLRVEVEHRLQMQISPFLVMGS